MGDPAGMSQKGAWTVPAPVEATALFLAGIDEQVLAERVASYLAFLRGHSGVWEREDAGLDSGDTLTPLLFHSWNTERDQP